MKAEEIKERRGKVRRLRARGITADEIAKALGVSRPTIDRDIAANRREARKHAKQVTAESVYRETCDVLNEALRAAAEALTKEARREKPHTGAIAGLIKVSIEAAKTKASLANDLGIIPEPPKRVQVEARVAHEALTPARVSTMSVAELTEALGEVGGG